MRVGLLVLALLLAGCHPRDAEALAIVRTELARLEAPAGMTALDPLSGLGEMDASAAQAYCVRDEKAGQVALDAMFKAAGWTAASAVDSGADRVWRYSKGRTFGSLTLEAKPQPCGRRFLVAIVEPL